MIVTEGGQTGQSGTSTKEQLEHNNIPTKVLASSAVGMIMPKVDCVFVGCEAVLENGGIVNKLGTFTVALCARTF